MGKKEALEYIDSKAELVTEVSDKIWGYAELSLMEHQSSELYVEVLKKEGFQVETPVCGIETAYIASYGSGKPIIGILAEYDALSGLSQEAGAVERKEVIPGGHGHGCGHNMLGAGAMAAGLGVKHYLEEKGEGSGTVKFYGCPGEEGAASKAFMAKEGVFNELDAALTWHPGTANEVTSGTCNSCIQTEYQFTGLASHAAGAPELGRSALDAVELMNIGVQFLREHMSDECRIHYSITDTGGQSPNVVQPKAQVLYMVRAKLMKDAMKLQARVDKIAEAAGMMTETTVKKKFIDGCSNTVPNKTLEQLLYRNFDQVGVPSYTEAELEFAKKLNDSCELAKEGLPGSMVDESFEAQEFVDQASCHGTKAMNDFLIPYIYSEKMRAGSTDVGDVSWNTPTAQIRVACFTANAPGHSWQNVSCGATSIGHKGVLAAGKVLAGAAIDLMENTELLAEARAEFEKKTKGGYDCPIPDGAKPVLAGEQM